MEPSISRVDAQVADRKALSAFFKSLPGSASLRVAVRNGSTLFWQMWVADTSTDYWLACDGKQVMCFTVRGLTLRQSARVRELWESLRNATPGIELDRPGLLAMVREVTGEPLATMQPALSRIRAECLVDCVLDDEIFSAVTSVPDAAKRAGEIRRN